MGNENSQPARSTGSPVPEKEDEYDMPFQYASYSVSKQGEAAQQAGKNGTPNESTNRMVLVSQKKQVRVSEPALEELAKIHPFYPILKSSIGATEDDHMFSELKEQPLIDICAEYQIYLHECALAIKQRQDTLASKIKWIDKNASERSQRYAKAAAQIKRHRSSFQQVKSLSEGINSISDKIHTILPLLSQLNNLLPEDNRLEPLELAVQREQNITSGPTVSKASGSPISIKEAVETQGATDV
eukprot:m.61845 g.61845  ORF g.61845 m.61845 type:complete len:243 (+) comp11454_c0_seq2:350-1078(+)